MKRSSVAREIMNCLENLNSLIAHTELRRRQGLAKPRGIAIKLADRLIRLKNRIEKEGITE